MTTAADRLFNCIGGIDDFFLVETDTADVRALRNKRMVRYGAAAAVVSVGMAMAYLYLKPNKSA